MISLAEKHPELIPEWDESNGKLTPWDVSFGSHKKVFWKGRCGHIWEAVIKNRGNGHGCPICSGNKVAEGINDLATIFPGLKAEWSERNLPLKPEQVTTKANREVWWKCRTCGHEWKARVADRTDGHGCPVCSGDVIAEGINDLATICPDLAPEWSEKNEPLSVTKVSPKSRRKVWWKCRICGHEWQAVIDGRVKGQTCPACSDRSVYPGFNDLATIFPDLVSEWDYEHNKGLTPDKILASSMRPVFWKDFYGHVWRAKISDRVKGAGCPYCTANRNYVFKLKIITYYSRLVGYSTRFLDDRMIGIPIEVYIPEKKVGIEFCGSRFNCGSIWMKESAKNWLCLKNGIKLFRIIPPEENGFDNCVCIKLPQDNIMNFKTALRTIFRISKIRADIDIERDIAAIHDTELMGENDDEEPDDKDYTTGTWNTTMACNMLPGL